MPALKFVIACDTTRALQEFMLAGLRERHTYDSPARLRRRFADLWLGPELARRASASSPIILNEAEFLAVADDARSR